MMQQTTNTARWLSAYNVGGSEATTTTSSIMKILFTSISGSKKTNNIKE